MKYLLFIGDVEPCKKSHQFVIQISERKLESAKKTRNSLRGRVCARNKKARWDLNHVDFHWLNPWLEMERENFPVFILVSQTWVEEQKWHEIQLQEDLKDLDNKS